MASRVPDPSQSAVHSFELDVTMVKLVEAFVEVLLLQQDRRSGSPAHKMVTKAAAALSKLPGFSTCGNASDVLEKILSIAP